VKSAAKGKQLQYMQLIAACPNKNLSMKTGLYPVDYLILRVGGRRVGLGISPKKRIPRKTELTEQMVISDRIPAVPRNRNSWYSVPNHSVEEKTTRNSVPWNKTRSILAEFRSEPFRGRENNSEFRSVEQK
jgi:hypothetical protein